MSSLDPGILYIIASGDESDRTRVSGTELVITGSSDMNKLLLEREPYKALLVDRNYFRRAQPRIGHFRVIVNLITEPEQNSRTLEIARKILRGVRAKVVNRPEAVLRSTRDQVARRLTGIIGLVVPRAVRLLANKPALAARMLADIECPIILRQAGAHGGKIIGRFASAKDAVAALQGDREHVATEFVDFRSADGLYRKYRIFFIGKRIILRHMLISDSWNVHASARSDFMAQRPELIAEERTLFESDGDPLPSNVRQVLEAVRQRMELDFFGMDFGVSAEGQVVLFEANATMSFFPFSPDPQFDYLHGCFAPAQAAFRELLDLPPESQPAAPFRLQVV